MQRKKNKVPHLGLSSGDLLNNLSTISTNEFEYLSFNGWKKNESEYSAVNACHQWKNENRFEYEFKPNRIFNVVLFVRKGLTS